MDERNHDLSSMRESLAVGTGSGAEVQVDDGDAADHAAEEGVADAGFAAAVIERSAAYRDQGLRAAAYLDHLAAAVTAASATMRWNGGDAAAVEEAMGRVRANLEAAQGAIAARADIVASIDTIARQGEAVPATEIPGADAEPARSPLPPEGYLVAATRALEAVRSQVDQALLGFQLAPRMSEMLFGALDAIQAQGEAGREAYLDYVLALDITGASR